MIDKAIRLCLDRFTISRRKARFRLLRAVVA
jgi:hypothetical protein